MRRGRRYHILVKSAIKDKYMITDQTIDVRGSAGAMLFALKVALIADLPVRKIEDPPRFKDGKQVKGVHACQLLSCAHAWPNTAFSVYFYSDASCRKKAIERWGSIEE
jgi:hypothetical protein